MEDFQRVLDEIRLTLDRSSKTFGELLFGNQPPRAPRYFQAVFLAFHKLLIDENQEVSDRTKLNELLSGSGQNISVPEGGRWGAQTRAKAVNSTAGFLSPVFQAASNYDPAQVRWITQLENILMQSYTEQAAYDFKQGVLRLEPGGKFDDNSWEKVLKTLVGIANIKRGTKGYVLIGIVEKVSDAQRLRTLFKVEPRPFEKFFISGIEHEAHALGKTLDQMFQLITDRV